MPELDETHDPQRSSWVETSAAGATDFPIQNLPFGVFRTFDGRARCGVAIGDEIVDIAAAHAAVHFIGGAASAAAACAESTLNALLALGNGPARAFRKELSAMLASDAPATVRESLRGCLVPMAGVELLLPVAVGAFTDFLCSLDHTKRMGDGHLPPAFFHLPIAYNSRATSVVVSGTAIRRPSGQWRTPDGTPAYGPEPSLDFELELGAYVGAGNPLGQPVPIADAGERVFGVCLLNDWSARGIQFFEGQPLGPFLGKSLATTVSPWIVTVDALEPFRCPPATRPSDAPPISAYLHDAVDSRTGGIDMELEASIRTAASRATGSSGTIVTRTNFKTMIWTFPQMLAHHTSNGCNLMPGDLLGSGTTSGPTDESRACLAELTQRGTRPIAVDSETRAWLNDDDEVVFHARAVREGYVPIGFGACSGVIEPALHD
jgi:fumarylacetoacetase